LQNISAEVQEAAMVDGASAWQRFWRVTLPQLRPAVFTVVTLGLIGAWQVFDQILTGTQGGPAKTTVTPAYLSYTSAFQNQDWPRGAAIAFVLFAIIIVMTIIQRWVLRDRDVSKRRMLLPRTAAVAETVPGAAVADRLGAADDTRREGEPEPEADRLSEKGKRS
jgi:multiple sugar transport system permease protein